MSLGMIDWSLGPQGWILSEGWNKHLHCDRVLGEGSTWLYCTRDSGSQRGWGMGDRRAPQAVGRSQERGRSLERSRVALNASLSSLPVQLFPLIIICAWFGGGILERNEFEMIVQPHKTVGWRATVRVLQVWTHDYLKCPDSEHAIACLRNRTTLVFHIALYYYSTSSNTTKRIALVS